MATNPVSPWLASAAQALSQHDLKAIWSKKHVGYNIDVHLTDDSLWILVRWPSGGEIAFRPAYAPAGRVAAKHIDDESDEKITLTLSSAIGDFRVSVWFPDNDNRVLRYTTTLKPNTDLFIPFWPRDIVIPANGHPQNAKGNIHVKQVGTRSGILYFAVNKPKPGTVMYLQDLSSLADYSQQTETSAAELVRGDWPELGFALPPTKEKPLAANKEVTISDAIVVLDEAVAKDEQAMIRQYFGLLAKAYLQLSKPETIYHNWPDTLQKGLSDLIDKPGCWSQVDGHAYFNAYVSDYVTPPEIMVQLAVMLPLIDYVEWSKSSLDVLKTIREGLPQFYNKKLGTIMRWLPAAEDKLEGEEEQKKPMVMDSWYLHHPLLNLSRLALKGDKVAKQLFLDSIGYAIKVAHRFKYQWPVFYHMETLEIIKAETAEGEGGQKDVPGIYAHVMLQAYELTDDKKYLHEAEKAAKTLQGLGFGLFYQANNTAFGAGALLRLFKITKNKLYLELSYLNLANVFNNVRLWDCNYGYGKNFPSFFCLFPLSNAPYTAVYEEQEVFCAFHDYLKHAEGEDILPEVKLLLADFIRFMVFRAVYYYPPMLPKEMLKDKPKIGEVDPKLWIALEDLHDGWEQGGEVGQEVYGAGNAFGILPRHYFKVPGEGFMIFVDSPINHFSARKGKPITFTVNSDKRVMCRMVLVHAEKHQLPKFTVTDKQSKQEIRCAKVEHLHRHYQLKGNQEVVITWSDYG